MTTTNLILVVGLAAAAVIATLALLIWVDLTVPQQRVYNCSLVEISPDVPPKVREACRRAQGGQR